MSQSAKTLIREARASVPILSPPEAAERIRGDERLLVLDVREPDEHAQGALKGAVSLPRGLLEFRIAEICPDPTRPLLVHCAAGGRALLAARTLRDLGYTNVAAVEGGFDDLRAACA